MYIASAATTVKLHDFETGEILHNYQPGTNQDGHVRSITLSSDGQWLSVVPYEGNVELVSIKGQLKLLRSIETVKDPTCAWFQSTDKRRLAIGANNGVVVVYDVKAKVVRKEYRSPTDEITRVRFTAQDSHCVAACKNGTVYVYNCVLNGKPKPLNIPKSKTVTCLATQPSKKNLVAGGSIEGTVVVWDLNMTRSKFQTQAHLAIVNCVSFSPKKPELVSTAGQDRTCHFFDTNNGQQVANINLQNCAASMDFTSDGQHFVLGHQNGQVSIYDLRNVVKPLRTYQAHNRSVKHLFCQPIGEHTTYESDISLEAAPVKQSSENVVKNTRFSDVFTFSFSSPVVDSNKSSEDAGGTPLAFRVDNISNLSMIKESLFSQGTPANDKRRMSVGELEGKLQYSSTPKTISVASTTAAGMTSIATQTDDTFDKSSLEDLKTELVKTIKNELAETIKNELQSVVTNLESTINTKKWECIFELRDTIGRCDFNAVKNIVELLGLVETIEANTKILSEDNELLMQKVEALENQFTLPPLPDLL